MFLCPQQSLTFTAPPVCPLEQSLASIKLETLQNHLEVSLNHTALGPTPRASLAHLQGPENLHFNKLPSELRPLISGAPSEVPFQVQGKEFG